MILLNHLTIRVSDYAISRDWYVSNFGFRVEFENLASGFGGLQDSGAVELILVQHPIPDRDRDCALTLQCDSVHDKYRELTSCGIPFVHEPKNVPWGYGAELLDPDGYRVMIWDRDTMPGYKER
jgi:catechol 2,3-dioxygenase-like lactoylglutathione lyase family enzyme